MPKLRHTLLLAILATGSCLLAQHPPSKSAVSPSVHLPRQTADRDNYIRNFQFSDLAASLRDMSPSPERDYFAGVLANREGHVPESIVLLEKVVPQIRSSNPARAAVALQTLADDYVKLFAYDKAIAAYADLLRNFAAQLDRAERQSTKNDYGAARLLQGAPPQTVAFAGAIDLPMHRNAVLGTLDADLTVNGATASWILDTGANFSTVSASFARRLGLQLSKGEAQTQGVTGAENKLHIAILPELKLGGATVRNIVLLVLEDSSLNVPTGAKTRYQIDAVLGYPVLQALQRITFTSDGHFLAGPA
ncbi:MAG: retropepsin-like aspartic protease [Terriglobales bacterium]